MMHSLKYSSIINKPQYEYSIQFNDWLEKMENDQSIKIIKIE